MVHGEASREQLRHVFVSQFPADAEVDAGANVDDSGEWDDEAKPPAAA